MCWFSDLLYRREAKTSVPIKVEKSIRKMTKIKVDLVNSEHLFYDLLFGDRAQESSENNEIEKLIIDRVSEVLINPNGVRFESFPKALQETLDKIDADCSVDEIQCSLERDPVLSADVVRLANTAQFNRNIIRITNLKLAINMVGLSSLKQIVTAASVAKMMQVSPLYFKLFGEKIWLHSINTAQISEKMARHRGDVDPYTAFFVGIIHDIGKIAIFGQLVGAIQEGKPDSEPGSLHFRKVMTSLSKQLTFNIVRSWQLPSEIVEPIKQHIVYKTVAPSNPLTSILIEAKLISELSLLYKEMMLDDDQVKAIFEKNGIEDKWLELVF